MNLPEHEATDLSRQASRRGIGSALVLLLVGLIASFLAASFTRSAVDTAARPEFKFACSELPARQLTNRAISPISNGEGLS